MRANTAFALTSVAALAGSAAAFNSHRHIHAQNQVDKRAVVTDWVTVYETVYVKAGQPKPSPIAHVANVPAPVVEAAPTPVVEVPENKAAQQPTTLQTYAKPAPSEVNPPAPKYDAPAPPTTTTKSSTGDSGSGPGFSGKRGLAYNDVKLANTFGEGCPSCGWGYNWGQSSGGLNSKFSFVPMLWSPIPIHTESWDDMATKALEGGSKAMFSFNECDNAGQANISPSVAAAGHKQYMNKYAGKALIGAPAITNSQNPGEGIQWLKGFMDACSKQEGGCAVDFCNVHWYHQASAADTLFTHLEQAHEACGGKPVWLTEFAPFGTPDEINNFIKTVTPKLDALEYLHAYSYFMVSADSLMSSSGSLSSIGQSYAVAA